jgi:hypothetical protein
MNDVASAKAQPPQPLFHTNIVPVSVERHAGLRLNRDAGFGFCAGAATLPIGLGEFEAAANSYPILFTDATPAVPVVLLGIRQGWNLFVGETGAWMAGAYVPAIVRAFPFAIINDAETGVRQVGFEADAACISPSTGLPLFDNGQPTTVVHDAVAFCEAVEADLNQAAAFGTAIEAAGVLQPGDATIAAEGGASARIAGYRTVDPVRLAAVTDDVFLEWRRRNWLGPLYAHLFSAANWVPFTELVVAQLNARQ